MRRPSVNILTSTIGLAALVAAVARELRMPRDHRSWHGKLLGLVPYDFRRPTIARLRHALWSPDDPRLLMPHFFGIGWTPNLGRLARRLAQILRRSS